MSASFRAGGLLVDNSAFRRGGHPLVRERWLCALAEGRLYRSPMLELEVLYGARNGSEHEALREELEGLRPLELTTPVAHAALSAQGELAGHAAGFHRLPPQDYFVAAIAAAGNVAVLHYDEDFDRIAEHSSLELESVWIAPRGSLGGGEPDPLRGRRRALSLALAQFSGERAEEVLDTLLDRVEEELRADGLQPPERP